MPHDEITFPQDLATGLQDTIDWTDAGGFAWLSHHPDTTNTVISGFEIDADWEGELLTIDSGVGVIEQEQTSTNDHTDDEGPEEKQVVGVSFRVQRGPSGDLTMNEGVNYVYVSLDNTENNTVNFWVNTDGNEPNEPHLLIAEVDTEEELIRRPNDFSSPTHNRVLVSDSISE